MNHLWKVKIVTADLKIKTTADPDASLNLESANPPYATGQMFPCIVSPVGRDIRRQEDSRDFIRGRTGIPRDQPNVV